MTTILVSALVPGDVFETAVVGSRKASHFVIDVRTEGSEVALWTLRYLPPWGPQPAAVSEVQRVYPIGHALKLRESK